MLLDLAGNKFDPNSVSIDDWQSEATALWEAGKAAYAGAQHVYSVVDQVFTAFGADRYRGFRPDNYIAPPRMKKMVAPGDGMEPIKGPMGNSTVIHPVGNPMAYKRKAGYQPYRRYGNKRQSNGISKTMATAVRKIAKRAIATSEESKHMQTALAIVQPTTAGLVATVSAVPQGTTDVTRIGDSINCVSLEMRGQIVAATGTDALRLLVFYYKPSFSVNPPLITDILEATPYVNSSYMWDEARAKEYTVILDRTFTSSLVAEDLDTFAFKIPLKGHKIQYRNASTTDQMNGIYTIMVNINGNASIRYTAHLVYKDP